MPHLLSWRPKKSNIKDVPEKPDWLPDDVYTQALAARYMYNTNWDMWVFTESQRVNLPIAEVEEACIRGIKRMFLQNRHVYGDKVGKWFEEFMDMDSIFAKVKMPEWEARLDSEEKK